MKHNSHNEMNDAQLDIDQRLAGPTEGNHEADNGLTMVNLVEHRQVQTAPQANVREDHATSGTTVRRRRRAKRRSRNLAFLRELKMLQSELFAEFVVITATAIESGMRCDRWRSNFQLMDELNILIDVGLESTDSEDSGYAERVEMASRVHDRCPTIRLWGKPLALRHHHDVHDAEAGITLRLHFTKEAHTCRIILGWIEEVVHGETHAHNAVAMSATIEA